MSGSKKEIMEATYEALCKHGYADLSIQKIADEFDKGKSVIYYHYDDKEELMLKFLDHLADRIRDGPEEFSDLGTDEKLDCMLEQALAIQDEEMWEFRKALMEMRAQTPHNERFADKFAEIDGVVQKEFRQVLEEKGVEEPGIKAELMVSAVEGVMNRKISYGNKENLEELKGYIKRISDL